MDQNATTLLDDTEVFGPNAPRDFYIVLVVGLFSLQLNLFGSLYIMYRAYLQWSRGGRNSIPLSLRFPVYIAFTDVLLSLGYTIDLGYTLITKHPWSDPACKIIGTSVITLFTLNMFIVDIVALTTWFYVCRERYIKFGSYDYKLWGVSLTLAAAIFAITLNNSGPQKYWCAGKFHDAVIPIVMIVFIALNLLTILVCYVLILLKIRNNEDALFATRHRRVRVEKRALRKLISYIFIFLLQFIPLIVYNFYTLATVENLLLHVLATTTINFGGIGNFIQFVINEGLRHSTKSNSQSSSEVKEQNEQNPPTNSVISLEIEPDTTSEIKDNIEIKINNSSIDEKIPDITGSNNSIENGEILVGKKEINTDNMGNNMGNNISDNYSKLDNDDTVIYDHLSTFDATVLVTANSSDVLLNREDDFMEELNQYTDL